MINHVALITHLVKRKRTRHSAQAVLEIISNTQFWGGCYSSEIRCWSGMPLTWTEIASYISWFIEKTNSDFQRIQGD